MAAPPNDHRHPYWVNLATLMERKHKLPSGLLVDILTKGERSNNNQISPVGARTVFQIMPETRRLFRNKYGVDAYLSPQNAAEVAALHLKESLDRNRGDKAVAIAEYNAGPGTVSRAREKGGDWTRNLPQETRKYLSRMGAAPEGRGSYADNIRARSEERRRSAPRRQSVMTDIEAVTNGTATQEVRKRVTDGLRNGSIVIPEGTKLPKDVRQAAFAPRAISAQEVEQYNSGAMPFDRRAEIQRDVREGYAAIPKGMKLVTPEEPGLIDGIVEAVTGTKRSTQEVEGLPDWATMPEMNDFSLKGMLTGAGTLLAGTPEAVKIIQANFPDVKVRQDAKGNFILQSGKDGKEYAVKPGFRVSDIPRAVGAVAAFTPAGRAATVGGAALAGAGTQAVIEGSQAIAGGNFDVEEVALAGLTGGAVPAVGKIIQAAKPAVSGVVNKVRGISPASVLDDAARGGAGAVDDVARPVMGVADDVMRQAPVSSAISSVDDIARPVAGMADNIAPVVDDVVRPIDDAAAMADDALAAVDNAPPVVGAVDDVAAVADDAAGVIDEPLKLNSSELGNYARKAANGGLGSRNALQILTSAVEPDARTLKAAKALGIEDYLQPDHLTTSQAYREMAQAVKSIPGSSAREVEIKGLEEVGRRADDLIREIGGTTDISLLNAGVRAKLEGTIARLETAGNSAYTALRETIPQTTRGPVNKAITFIQNRAVELDGAANVSALEKRILNRLAPKIIRDADGVVTAVRQPTYALIDDVRKEVGRAARQQGAFKDADSGLAKKLYALLDDDQFALADTVGMGPQYRAAKAIVAQRKGIEDDMVALFGRGIDQSLVAKLTGATQALAKGDAEKFVKVLKSIPKDMREEVVASAISTAFGKATKNGTLNFNSFARWFEGVSKNSQAYAALMTNLPSESRRKITNLYRVSKGISAATRENITTGRIQAVRADFDAVADSTMYKLYGLAKRSAVGIPAEGVTSMVGLPGAGIASGITAAMTKNAPSAIKAVDDLIASPEFIAAVSKSTGAGAEQAARKLARSGKFKAFADAIKLPREMSAREQWVLRILQVESQFDAPTGVEEAPDEFQGVE